MGEILYPYLVAVVVTVATLLTGIFAYLRYQKAAIDHQSKAERIPDFIRYVQLGEKIAELEERREQLAQQVAQAEATIDEAADARMFLEQNGEVIQQSRLAREQLQHTESELITKREELAIAKQECGLAVQERSKADFERELQERATEAVRTEHAKLESDARTLRERIDGLEACKQELLREEATLRETEARLRAEVAGLEGLRSQLRADVLKLEERESRARASVNALEVEEQRLSTIKAALETQLGDSAKGSDEEELEDLREPLIDLTHLQRPREALTEVEAIEMVAQHLENHELRFSTRVLNAFHTALKVQIESPLLVLAGISGTGKSLLPQRYAEAMGIHCHVVPVQPRWDGPQDLLGFYHHLERRFKATPLTRGLVQFDHYCEVHDGEADLSDRMMLVVLDEMNLARVEYYFSEFLSRLETRRDVDIDEEVSRLRAAVQLELGLKDGRNQTFNLFVDKNVLFVGTINEDESTQTLSDKVIDRANVIRFGRPKKLARPEQGMKRKIDANGLHLPRSVWQGWLENMSPLSSAQLTLVKETADSLNDALGAIGRSFGHRTYRAILAYAQHYPVRDEGLLTEQGMRWALADQIEQRILPKLRGLDPTEGAAGRAILEVLEVVHNLGDRELESAIEQGREGHSFLWQGIDRTE